MTGTSECSGIQPASPPDADTVSLQQKCHHDPLLSDPKRILRYCYQPNQL
ncbi:hypothetical protein S683_001964 [Salmonella enterica subsp. enterica serovar Senftenberg]|nr:hypothetical protein [Salmonella enterica subsp. enterica serovar Senftenberg]